MILIPPRKLATAYEMQIGCVWIGWVHLKGGYWKFWRRPFIRFLLQGESEIAKRKIKVGKKYMLIHGDDEGPDFCRSPTADDIDLSRPVTVVREYRQHEDGERRWKITFTSTDGEEDGLGYASDRSFGKEIK